MGTVKIQNRKLLSNLYKHDLYLQKDHDYIIGKRITEYDIKSANTNLCRYYNLLPENEINRLEALPKSERVKQIGLKMRNDRKFAEALSKSFKNIRKEFFIANEIEDSDILSIKKDAIFIVGKRCRNTEFNNIHFVEKNVYSSFHRLNNLEFYYSGKDNEIAIKGINDDSLYQYKKFLNILKKIFRLLELNNREEFVKFMKRFIDDYKNKRLNYEYYKELRTNGCYTLIQKDNTKKMIYGLDGMDETVDELLCINYNYIAYILPIFQRHYFGFKKL